MARPYIKISYDWLNRMDDYNMLLDRVADIMKDGARQTVIGSAIRFARTAARYTPPAVGAARIPADLCKRGKHQQRNLEDDETWNHYGSQHWARVERYGNKTPFGLKRPGRKWEWYASADELKKNEIIWGRGSARYGWLQALPVLGAEVPAIVPGRLAFMAPKLLAQGKNGRTWFNESDTRTEVVIEHDSYYCKHEPIEYAAARALSLVNHGLKQQLKRLEKDLEEVPF